jgi:hypothetical protein
MPVQPCFSANRFSMSLYDFEMALKLKKTPTNIG